MNTTIEKLKNFETYFLFERDRMRVALEKIATQYPLGPKTSEWMQGVARGALQPLT